MTIDYTPSAMERSRLVAQILHAATLIVRKGNRIDDDWRDAAESINRDFSALLTAERGDKPNIEEARRWPTHTF